MRLIDADALLSENRTDYPDVPFDALGEMVEWFTKIVDEQPTVTASQWHRVESFENLPEESGPYIVYLRQGTKAETPEWMGGEPLSYVTEMAFDREQMLWRADDDVYNAILSFVDTEKDFHVTHWMEKPEPPKEDA